MASKLKELLFVETETGKKLSRKAQATIGILVLLFIVVALAVVDLQPDYSRIKTPLLSAGAGGYYDAVARDLGEMAARGNGDLVNVNTGGSVTNLKKLAAARESCEVKFALVQDGLQWEKMPRGIELLGRLPKPETVFFLGPRADEIRSFRDLDGKRVGIGAKGSGTASVARQVLTSHGFENLDLTLSQHSSKEQIAMLQRGDLDIAVFVMEKNSQMIEKAVRQQGMHIASFIQAPAMAARLPFVRSGVLPAGYYDPVEVVPAADRHLLEVDTLVAMNSCPSRSEMMAFLELLSEKYPDFIRHNIETPAHPAVSLAPAAKAFFDNRGPEFLDRHVPWLADIIPLSNLVTLAMVVSVLFNVMGAGHRFRLWRIDANRIAAEQRIEDLFGVGVTMSDISDLDPDAKYRETKNMAELDSIIKDLTNLARKVRDYSTSMLVPMGQEMAYRYQENTIRDIIVSLQDFREKLD